MNRTKIVFTFLFLSINIMAGNLSDSAAVKFISLLIAGSKDLDNFVLPEEFQMSRRLGITYENVPLKYLISNDLDTAVRRELQTNKNNYSYEIEKLSGDYSKLVLSIPSRKIQNEYYFKNEKLISAPYYYSMGWKKIESEYFVFHISDSTLFNSYTAQVLDRFVSKISALLKYTQDDTGNLKRNKIHYFLCGGDDEIKLLTGYAARGLYYLPFDYIISTYNCHFHELLHLLINYKLQRLPLYTLPFLQEGFAVAFGGRGGQDPGVILESGLFLEMSGFVDYTSLLNLKDFRQYDATLSYPVSGLYNKFLLTAIGAEKYLELYKKYSSDERTINDLRIKTADLPSVEKWKEYITDFSGKPMIVVGMDSQEAKSIVYEKKNESAIYETGDYYLFELKDAILISTNEEYPGYRSKLFGERFPKRKYASEKYAVIADSSEISIYNFFTNNLVAKFASGFSLDNKSVPKQNGYYYFNVRKNLFEEPINGKLNISE